MPPWFPTAVLLAATLVLGGGTLHGWSAAVVELISLPVIAFSLVRISGRRLHLQLRIAGAIAAAAVFLPLLQLIPVPPGVWTSIPGHTRFAEDLAAAGAQIGWLPLSLDPGQTFLAFAGVLPPLGIFLSSMDIDYYSRRVLTIILIGFGCISLIVGLTQIAAATSGILQIQTSRTAIVGFFANSNHLAALMYCVIPFTAAWGVGLAAKRSPATTATMGLCGLVTVAMLVGIFSVGSRAGYALACFSALGGAALAWTEGSKSRRRFVHTIITAVVALCLVVTYGLSRVVEELDSDITSDLRWEYAGNTFRAAADFVPAGSGFGTFVPIYRMYEGFDQLRKTYVNHAHNDYLEAFLEGGLPAVLILVAFLAWFFRNASRLWTGGDHQMRSLDLAISRAASISILLLLLHSLVDYPLRTISLLSVFALCCAFLVPASGTHPIAVPDGGRMARHRSPSDGTSFRYMGRSRASVSRTKPHNPAKL